MALEAEPDVAAAVQSAIPMVAAKEAELEVMPGHLESRSIA